MRNELKYDNNVETIVTGINYETVAGVQLASSFVGLIQLNNRRLQMLSLKQTRTTTRQAVRSDRRALLARSVLKAARIHANTSLRRVVRQVLGEAYRSRLAVSETYFQGPNLQQLSLSEPSIYY